MKQHSVAHSTADSVRRLLFGGGHGGLHNGSSHWLMANGTEDADGFGREVCTCLSQLEQICIGPENNGHYMADPSPLAFNSEVGRMLYTISILMMFSLVILLLMFRSIRRSRSTVEVETLLDAMRFREELDLQKRQKKQLRKAKKKVTAWLCRGNGAKLWQSSPHIVLPNSNTNAAINRTNSIQSSGSFIPEIVISEHLPVPSSAGLFPPPDMCRIERQNSCTPSLSLIYDFSSRRNSRVPSSSASPDQHSTENGRISQSSAISGNGQGKAGDGR